jgi:C4-dicarboxylate-specific signal transduction histidine kinase
MKELALVSISDSGRGIAKQHVGRVFDPFFITKDMGEGMGLGLSISHGSVKEHGGPMGVESEAGRKITFRIKLPVGGADAEGPDNR